MWTQFMDMHSGGGLKEAPKQYIYIEASEAEARVIFYNRFGHSPNRVSCTCCGEDYSLSEGVSLLRVTAFERHCDNLNTPRDSTTGLYRAPDDPWFEEHYYLEPDEVIEATRRGYVVHENTSKRIGRQHGSDFGRYQTLAEYLRNPEVLVIADADIKPEWRTGGVPEQGYAWQD